MTTTKIMNSRIYNSICQTVAKIFNPIHTVISRNCSPICRIIGIVLVLVPLMAWMLKGTYFVLGPEFFYHAFVPMCLLAAIFLVVFDPKQGDQKR